MSDARAHYLNQIRQICSESRIPADDFDAVIEYEKTAWPSLTEHRCDLDNFCLTILNCLTLITPITEHYFPEQRKALYYTYWDDFIAKLSGPLTDLKDTHEKTPTYTKQTLAKLTDEFAALAKYMVNNLQTMLKQAGMPKGALAYLNNMEQAEKRLKHWERETHISAADYTEEDERGKYLVAARTLAELVEGFLSTDIYVDTSKSRSNKVRRSSPSAASPTNSSNSSSPTPSAERGSHSSAEENTDTEEYKINEVETANPRHDTERSRHDLVTIDLESGTHPVKTPDTRTGHKEPGKPARLARPTHAFDPIATHIISQNGSTAITHISEQAHQGYDETTNLPRFDSLDLDQIIQYIYLAQNTEITFDDQGKCKVTHQNPRAELFWFYLSPKHVQIDIARRLEHHLAEAKTTTSYWMVFARKISILFAHVGSGARDSGPAPHIPLSTRTILWQKTPDTDFKKIFDGLAYPSRNFTSGTIHRMSAPMLNTLDWKAFKEPYIGLVMRIIEHDIDERAKAMVLRYKHELGEWFETHGHTIELTLTRFLINLLTPTPFDPLIRLILRVLGKDYPNDNGQMTQVVFEAVSELRKKYLTEYIEVKIDEKCYAVKVNFAQEVHGINALRALGPLFCINTHTDVTAIIASLCQIAHELTLHANALQASLPKWTAQHSGQDAQRTSEVVPRESHLAQSFVEIFTGQSQQEMTLLDIPEKLMEIARELMRFSSHSEVNWHPIQALETMHESICKMKHCATDLYEKEPQHSLHTILMRLEYYVIHLKTHNHRYRVLPGFSGELMSASTFGVAMPPEAVSRNCKSGHDRTGIEEDQERQLITHYYENGRTPPNIVKPAWYGDMGRDLLLQTAYDLFRIAPTVTQQFFGQHYARFSAVGHECKERGESGDTFGIKSLPKHLPAWYIPIVSWLCFGYSTGAQSYGFADAARRAKDGKLTLKHAATGSKLDKFKLPKSTPDSSLIKAAGITPLSKNPRQAAADAADIDDSTFDRFFNYFAKQILRIDAETLERMDQTHDPEFTKLRESIRSITADSELDTIVLGEATTLRTIYDTLLTTRNRHSDGIEVRHIATQHVHGSRVLVENPLHQQHAFSHEGVELSRIHRSRSGTQNHSTLPSLSTELTGEIETQPLRSDMQKQAEALLRDNFQWALMYHHLDSVGWKSLLQATIGVLLCSLATVLTYQFYGIKNSEKLSFQQDWSKGNPGNNVFSYVIISFLFMYPISASVLWFNSIVNYVVTRSNYQNSKKDLVLFLQVNQVEQKDLTHLTAHLKITSQQQGRYPHTVVEDAMFDLEKTLQSIPSRKGFSQNEYCKKLLGTLAWNGTFVAVAVLQEFANDLIIGVNLGALGARRTQEAIGVIDFLRYVLDVVSLLKLSHAFYEKWVLNQRLPTFHEISVNMNTSYLMIESTETTSRIAPGPIDGGDNHTLTGTPCTFHQSQQSRGEAHQQQDLIASRPI